MTDIDIKIEQFRVKFRPRIFNKDDFLIIKLEHELLKLQNDLEKKPESKSLIFEIDLLKRNLLYSYEQTITA